MPPEKRNAPAVAAARGAEKMDEADSTNSAGAGQAKQAAVCKGLASINLRSDLHRPDLSAGGAP